MLKVIVIGGVAAGMSAAAKLKRNLKDGVEVVVYEKSDQVSYGACGIPYYVSGRIEKVSSLVERTAEQFIKSGIDVRLRHEVLAVDLRARKVSGRNVETGDGFVDAYDKLVVATGARVRKIPPLDVELENLCVVRGIDDAVRLRALVEREDIRDVVVVGAGFIGLEMAEACARRGKRVLLVEFSDRILPVMDPEFTDQLAMELGGNHVAIRTDSKVAGLVRDGDRIVRAVVESKDGDEEVAADLVINCAGIIPNAECIDVKKAVNGAIIVNERMETSDPDVYAAGDCSVMTSFVTGEHQYAPLGSNANKQGKIIAELLSGREMCPFRLVGCSAVKVFSLDAAKVGLSEIDAQRLNLDYKINRITGNSYASYYGDEKVMIKLVYNGRTRAILGAQVVGRGDVVPRANYFAIAIASGMSVDDFGYLDLCYSPPFGGVWDVALIAATTSK